MSRILFLALALGGVVMIHPGCSESPEDVANGNDPLAALAVSVQSSRYDGMFWRRQHGTDPALFQAAVDYCEAQDLAERPNCEPVLTARQLIESMNRPHPEGRGYTGILSEDKQDSAASVEDTLDHKNQ